MAQMGFSFRGEISSSKSIFNRALITHSFSDQIQVHGVSQSEDVLHLLKSLAALKKGEKKFYCGDGGTTFRFLALRVSRERGEFILSGSTQLFSRPMKELLHFFDQVGVHHDVNGTTLTIKGSGWVLPPEVYCLSTESSQFLSAIILSAWDLPKDLNIIVPSQIPSRGYLDMTVDLFKSCGGHIENATSDDNEPMFTIPSGQILIPQVINVEQDMSSLFALAACAVMDGDLEIKNVATESIQPDFIFFEFFRKMNIHFELMDKVFFIHAQDKFGGIDADLSNCPDLFPVLAVLASKAKGTTTLTGLKNLQFKESNRYDNTTDLLHRLGRRVDKSESGVIIYGKPDHFTCDGDFDPHGDHRMAMAAQVANLGGAKLNILDKSVVKKSFPEFWGILGQ